MIKVDCKHCDSCCCTSKKRRLFVVLTPKEERESNKKIYRIIKTKYGKIAILKKNTLGECIYHDKKKNICKIYSKRPFECKLYPVLIHFENNKITFKKDNLTCPKADFLDVSKINKVREKLLRQKIQIRWIKAYSSLDQEFMNKLN